MEDLPSFLLRNGINADAVQVLKGVYAVFFKCHNGEFHFDTPARAVAERSF